MNAFLITCSIMWIAFGLGYIIQEAGKVDWILWFIWPLGCFGIVPLVLYVLLERTEILVTPDTLKVTKSVLGLRACKASRVPEITRLVQVQDGGQGEDSFASWGLRAKAGKDITIIFRQPYQVSQWLGSLLSTILGVPFEDISPFDDHPPPWRP